MKTRMKKSRKSYSAPLKISEIVSKSSWLRNENSCLKLHPKEEKPLCYSECSPVSLLFFKNNDAFK